MITITLSILAIIVGAVLYWYGKKKRNAYEKTFKDYRSPSSYGHGNGIWGFGVGAMVAGAAMLLGGGVIGSAINYGHRNEANTVYSKMEVIISQRDQLVPLVRDELSAEQFDALMEATSTEGSVAQIIWGEGASKILIERASRIIQLNTDVFTLRNKALDAELAICANRNNPFTPRLPFTGPECNIEFRDSLLTEPVVSKN